MLERIRFYFDVLEESSEAYYFVTDYTARVTLISKKWARDFGLEGSTSEDIQTTWLSMTVRVWTLWWTQCLRAASAIRSI